MPSHKDRLYVALLHRGGAPRMPDGEDKCHWALIIGPKNELPSSRGRLLHVRDESNFDFRLKQPTWYYEEMDIPMAPGKRDSVRILVGKVKDMARLRRVVEAIPVRSEVKGWNDVVWVKEALEAINQDDAALGASIPIWQCVRDTAMWYIEEKQAAGRFAKHYDKTRVATWDICRDKEIVY